MSNSRNNINVSLNKKLLSELVSLVDHRENDTMNMIFTKIMDEFNLMSNCLAQNNMLEALHPEWQFTSENTEALKEPNFEKLSKVFDKKE
jgi:hypothetical protein